MANAQIANSAKPTYSHIAKLDMKPGITKSIKPIEAGHQDKVIYGGADQKQRNSFARRVAGSARRAARNTGGSRGDEQFLVYEIARENAGDSGRGD